MAFHFSCLKFETLSDSWCSLCIIHYNYINNNCVFWIKQFITWLGSWFVTISMVRDLLCQYQCDWLAGKCRLRNDLLRVESYVKTCRHRSLTRDRLRVPPIYIRASSTRRSTVTHYSHLTHHAASSESSLLPLHCSLAGSDLVKEHSCSSALDRSRQLHPSIHPSMFISQKSQIRHVQHALIRTKSEWCNK